MRVKDLIEALQKFDPELQVMLDVPHPDMEIFRFASLDNIEQVGVQDSEIVVIYPPHSVLATDVDSNN